MAPSKYCHWLAALKAVRYLHFSCFIFTREDNFGELTALAAAQCHTVRKQHVLLFCLRISAPHCSTAALQSCVDRTSQFVCTTALHRNLDTR